MVKRIIFIAALAALAITAAADMAQAAKKCPRTKDQCLAACRKASGTLSGCVRYCDDKERNTGCP